MKEPAGHLEPCVSRGNTAAPCVTLVRPRGSGAQEERASERRVLVADGQEYQGLTNPKSAVSSPQRNQGRGASQLPHPRLSCSSAHNSCTRMLFVKVIIPSVTPVWTKQPKTDPARSSFPGQFDGDDGGRQGFMLLPPPFASLQFGQNGLRQIQLIPPFPGQSDGDDVGLQGFMLLSPPVSRLGLRFGAATGVLQKAIQHGAGIDVEETQRRCGCFERAGMSAAAGLKLISVREEKKSVSGSPDESLHGSNTPETSWILHWSRCTCCFQELEEDRHSCTQDRMEP